MAAVNSTSKDRERFARARAQGHARLRDQFSVVGVGYDSARHTITVSLRDGGSMAIPLRMIPRLRHASIASLEAVSVSPAGDALYWPSLDGHISMPGIVERAFGKRLFAAETVGGRTPRAKSEEW